MAIGANWEEIWADVWMSVWTSTPAEQQQMGMYDFGFSFRMRF